MENKGNKYFKLINVLITSAFDSSYTLRVIYCHYTLCNMGRGTFSLCQVQRSYAGSLKLATVGDSTVGVTPRT